MLFETSNIRVQTEDQIATLWLEFPDTPLNLLNSARLDELEQALLVIRELPLIDVLLIRSGKGPGLASGYDPNELDALTSPDEWSSFAAHGQRVLNTLAGMSERMPTIALIDGPCRDAGLELALACEYRLALAGPSTELGFPMVNRGLMPCWGGTQRLPRLLGLRSGLRMLLSGETISAREAAKRGLVDHVFCERRSRIELRAFMMRLQERSHRSPRPRSMWHRLHDRIPLLRNRLLRNAESSIEPIERQQRPGFASILNAVRLGLDCFEEGLAQERSEFASISQSAAARNGIRLQIHSEQPAKIHPEPPNPIPSLPDVVGVIGGGEIGASVIRWLALRGRKVILQEANDRSLQLSNLRIERLFEDAVSRGWCTPLEAQQSQKSIQRTICWEGFEQVGLVIESVEEDLGVKRAVLHEVEEHIRPRVPIASTSSTFRIEAFSGELNRPCRVVGLHFPPHFDQTPLVEVVKSASSDSMTLATLDCWMRALGRIPIVVTDRPGRVVQRVLLAYLSEAVLLVSEGLPPDVIDGAMRRFGMVEGPLEYLDRLGIHRVAEWSKHFQDASADRSARHLMLEPMRALGWTGRESGEGFYRYHSGQPRANEIARMLLWREVEEDVVARYIFDPEQAVQDGVRRLVLRTINEAAACLSDEHPATIDLALTMGMGWAPHWGGPLRYADTFGVNQTLEQLRDFVERFGCRFRPSNELVIRGEAGESFHGLLAPEIPRESNLRRVAM